MKKPPPVSPPGEASHAPADLALQERLSLRNALREEHQRNAERLKRSPAAKRQGGNIGFGG